MVTTLLERKEKSIVSFSTFLILVGSLNTKCFQTRTNMVMAQAHHFQRKSQQIAKKRKSGKKKFKLKKKTTKKTP